MRNSSLALLLLECLEHSRPTSAADVAGEFSFSCYRREDCCSDAVVVIISEDDGEM